MRQNALCLSDEETDTKGTFVMDVGDTMFRRNRAIQISNFIVTN
jgi:hypothetical protein